METAVETPNLVSQALTSAKFTAQQIGALTGLPAEAVPIQAAGVALAAQIVPAVSDVQSRVQRFLQSAVPLLTSALTALDGPDPGQAKAAIVEMQAAAADLAPAMATANAVIGKERDAASSCIRDVAGVEGRLDRDIAAAKAKQQTDRADVEALNSKKSYWLALGALGVAGLAIAISELDTANANVAAVEAKISALGLQVSQFTKMKVDVQRLSDELQALADKLQSLKNAIDFVSADIQSALTDLDGTAIKSAAKAYLLTAKGQLATLAAETA